MPIPLAFSSRIRACTTFGRDDMPKLELSRRGNLSDLEKAAEYKSYYYDDAVEGDRDHD